MGDGGHIRQGYRNSETIYEDIAMIDPNGCLHTESGEQLDIAEAQEDLFEDLQPVGSFAQGVFCANSIWMVAFDFCVPQFQGLKTHDDQADEYGKAHADEERQQDLNKSASTYVLKLLANTSPNAGNIRISLHNLIWIKTGEVSK